MRYWNSKVWKIQPWRSIVCIQPMRYWNLIRASSLSTYMHCLYPAYEVLKPSPIIPISPSSNCTVCIQPMRYWNAISLGLIIDFLPSFVSSLWGIETVWWSNRYLWICYRKSLYPAYEVLKLDEEQRKINFDLEFVSSLWGIETSLSFTTSIQFFTSLYPAYEVLKLMLSFLCNSAFMRQVCIQPMRYWNLFDFLQLSK